MVKMNNKDKYKVEDTRFGKKMPEGIAMLAGLITVSCLASFMVILTLIDVLL